MRIRHVLSKVWSNKFSRVGTFIFSFALLGTALLQFTKAATPTTSIDLGATSVSSPASNVSDGTAFGGSAVKFGTPAGNPTIVCDINATTGNFAAQITAATTGQTICLAAGNYGTWSGVNKAITISRQSGVAISAVTLGIDFNNGDANFIIDGLTVTGGDIVNSANQITIRNSTFTSPVSIDVTSTSGAIILDKNIHNNYYVAGTNCSTTPGMIMISGSGGPSRVVVSNSVISNTNLDGVRVDSSNGATIIGNEFFNIEELNDNDCHHTDSIQFYGGANTIIQNNFFRDSSNGIVAFDRTSGNQIKGNACVRLGRGACVTLYSDQNSVIEYNTAGANMNVLELDRKAADPAGSGTIFRNNVGEASTANGSTIASNINNLYPGASSPNISGNPIFEGGSSPTAWEGYKLAGNSPGITGATDGGSVGIRP